jgi:diguanylate cyclase (GGDEF)-like protein
MELDHVLGVALVALLGLLAVVATIAPPAGRRLRRRPSAADAAEVRSDADLRPAALERVLRVGTWLFLFVVAAVVLVTDLWHDRERLILVLLAIAAIYVFIVHELLPAGRPDRLVLVSEGMLGLVFAGLLVGMTGGVVSPFTAVFAMVAAGAAVVVSERAAVAASVAAGAAYVVAVAIGSPMPIAGGAIAVVAVNLAVIFLVGYVGMALASEHRHAREEVVRRATEDALTGLRTRGFAFSALERELRRSERTGRAFCLLMLDLDDLKGINDRLGHGAGDAALRTVGEVIQARIRRIDTGARFGGDEFVVLLPETDPTGGWVVAEQIRRGVTEARRIVDGMPVSVTVSVGVVAYPHDATSVAALLERADEAMYRSKRTGRDRVSGSGGDGQDADAPALARDGSTPRPLHVGPPLTVSPSAGSSDDPV